MDHGTHLKPEELIQPTPLHLVIKWNDGHESVYTWQQLRRACPCAECVDEVTGVKTLDDTTVPDDLTCSRIEPVGRYGLQFTFSDKHDTGIYRFEFLRHLEISG